MCYAPHPLRLRSAPSPQGEGMKKGNNIAFPPPRGLFSPNYRLKVVLAAWWRRTATNEGRSLFSVIKNYIEFETAPYRSTSLTAFPPRGSHVAADNFM